MKEVTKEQFKGIYFKLGGGKSTGWDPDYWNQFYESPKRPGMKFLVQEPETKKHNRMKIVTNYSSNEHRLFFMTEEAKALLNFPDEAD